MRGLHSIYLRVDCSGSGRALSCKIEKGVYLTSVIPIMWTGWGEISFLVVQPP